jgi:hypothetical protein
MKKIILTLALTLSTSVFSQLAPPRTKINLNLPKPTISNQSNVPVGPIMMLGGATFMLAGFLTVPPTEGSSLTPKPFFKQGGRMLAIMSGGATFLVGATFSLGSR